jgi:hypothetical protein
MSDLYKPNQAGWRQIALSPAVRAVVETKAEAGKRFAEALSEDFRRTGEYADSFAVVPETLLWRRGPRAAARLENTSGHAAAVEWSGDTPHRILGKTLAALEGL